MARRPSPPVSACGHDRETSGPVGAVRRREVFRAEQMLGLPAGCHFAPGTEQNLPANGCMRFHSSVRCDGIYWFRLFPLRFWDTTRLPDGRYRVVVRAWDVAGNLKRDGGGGGHDCTTASRPREATGPGRRPGSGRARRPRRKLQLRVALRSVSP